MANTKEIAQFYRFALRLQLATTMEVERWTDSVIAAQPVAAFPFTELSSASHRSRAEVDEWLGQISGTGDMYLPGRMVMAQLRRRVLQGTIPPEAAIKLALELALQALTEEERYDADVLDDDLWLATSGTCGNPQSVRQKLEQFLDRYAKFEAQVPS